MKIKTILTNEELEDIDTVIPIPDTSRTSALPISIELGKELKEGFVKNRYIGRTFIMPGQKMRKKNVRRKLNPIKKEFLGFLNLLIPSVTILKASTSRPESVSSKIVSSGFRIHI